MKTSTKVALGVTISVLGALVIALSLTVLALISTPSSLADQDLSDPRTGSHEQRWTARQLAQDYCALAVDAGLHGGDFDRCVTLEFRAELGRILEQEQINLDGRR